MTPFGEREAAGWWNAVRARDGRADGAFVYGVRSTGVYCRPSCPSRRPSRASVEFFADPAAAERAGFRACRRCRPNDEATVQPALEKVRRACALIRANPERTLTLGALAARVGSSPYHLQRMFTRVVGVSPRAYAEACRLGRLKALLKRGQAVTPALYEAGYGSSSRLYERSGRTLGMTPGVYRRGGAGMQVGYTVVDSPLGRLLVAATARGVCSVKLGEADAPLERDLRAEYPAAAIRQDRTRLVKWVQPIVAHLEGRQPHLDLPIDVRATAFQWKVWRQLQAIPYGRTKSYGEVARAIGLATGARAVARACARNPVALAIPCHRVVRGDGDVGGYRWGVERKQRLVANERSTTKDTKNTITTKDTKATKNR